MTWPVLLTALGMALASLAADGPTDDRSLEARVIGIDGVPVKTSSMIFWKLVTDPEREPKDATLWRDPETGDVWRNIGGAATGDRMRRDDLAPGTYRVSAHEGHHQATPLGMSEP